MTDREWIERTVRHEESGAVPYNFMFSPPAERIAQERYGDNLEDALALPMRMTAPWSCKPLYADPGEYGGEITDEFGVRWSTSAIDRGSPIGPCLLEPDLSRYVFPDATAPARFASIGPWCAAQEGHYRVIWVGDLWERATFMRGMEALLLDVALNRRFVEALLAGLTDYIIETVNVLAHTATFECIAVSDDYGSQRGMLISPDDWRALVKPCLRRIYGQAKDHGLAVFHHSCGNILPIVPDMVDLGLDILHPIQPEAMDIARLKREHGHHLTFCGGVSTQDLLVSATPEQIRAEVQRLKREMGAGGGYILEPGITLQADVPASNLYALIDEARAL